MVDAVIFDWGGTLSKFVDAELVDAWRLAARHLDPEHEDEITERLVKVEAEFWATTQTVLRPNPYAPDIDGIEPDARISRLPELVDVVEGWRS